jgi:hypothetical protein
MGYRQGISGEKKDRELERKGVLWYSFSNSDPMNPESCEVNGS